MISVLIPVHNRAQMLDDALASLSVQTFKEFKVVIYDDASDENTREVVEKYHSKLDIYPIYALDKAPSIGHVRNQFRNVKTLYSCWLDSDDVCHPRRLELLVKYLETNTDKILVMSNIAWYNASMQSHVRTGTIDITKYDSTLERPLRPGKIAFATSMFKSNLLTDFPFHPHMQSGEDAQWLTDIFKVYPDSFGHIPESLYLGRIHQDRISIKKRSQ